MVSEYPLFPGSDSHESFSRLLIDRIGLEFDPNTVKLFEGVLQKEILSFGVDWGSLPWAGDPGPSDLEPAMVSVDCRIAGGTDHRVRRFLHLDEREGMTFGLPLQCRLDVCFHVFGGTNNGGGNAPEFRIEADGAELRVVIQGERLKSDEQSFESHRPKIHELAVFGHQEDGPSERMLLFIQSESDFHCYLPLAYLAVLDMAACLHDLQPSHVPDGLAGKGDGILDGILNSGG